jgi:hypothetical protein
MKLLVSVVSPRFLSLEPELVTLETELCAEDTLSLALKVD